MKSLVTVLTLSLMTVGCVPKGFRAVGPIVGPEGVMPATPPDPGGRPAGPMMLHEVPDVPPPPTITDDEIDDTNAAAKIEELRQELADAKARPDGRPVVSSQRK